MSDQIEPTDMALTLRAQLERRHRKGGANGVAESRRAQHTRQAYKLFLMPAGVAKRLQRLTEDVRALVELAITRFGGLMTRSLCQKAGGSAGAFDRDDLAHLLEEALVGTVGRLDLRRYGIAIAEPTLCVFQEICLVSLRARGAPRPPSERVVGVNLATDVMRFLRYIDEEAVRFTVQGEIFKATRKRMLGRLLAETSEEAETSLAFIQRFALARRLVERTGERTLSLSDAGRSFEQKDVADKLKDLLSFAIADPGGAGDAFHQIKLRRVLLRLLRRVDAEVWYDPMYLPFLARNSYLAQLDRPATATYYATGRGPLDDMQELSWHLFHWIRKRLHPLGIVDLGFEGGHAVALRLSKVGASLLAGVSAQAAEGARSTLVVNPDFDVLLFPEADAWDLVHTLDRFATRTGSEHLFRFVLTEESVRSALSDGMGVGEILGVLTDRTRTPLPQNVVFSLRDWGERAGAVRIDGSGSLRALRTETLTRLLANGPVREMTDVDGNRVRVRKGVRIEDFRAVLRDLGFCLEVGRSDRDECA